MKTVASLDEMTVMSAESFNAADILIQILEWLWMEAACQVT